LVNAADGQPYSGILATPPGRNAPVTWSSRKRSKPVTCRD